MTGTCGSLWTPIRPPGTWYFMSLGAAPKQWMQVYERLSSFVSSWVTTLGTTQLSESPFGIRLKCCSDFKSCLTLPDPVDGSTPGFPSFAVSWSLLTFMSIESMMPSNHLILCCPFLFLPSIFPNMRVFSSESALCIRWPKYWSFSFSHSPSTEYSGLISFRMDWFGLLALAP